MKCLDPKLFTNSLINEHSSLMQETGKQTVLHKCGNYPWLIEAEDEPVSFLYLKTKGYELTPNYWQYESRQCSTNNRIIIYSGFDPRNPKIVCPIHTHNTKNMKFFEIFSDGWNTSLKEAKRMDPISRSFVIEFLNSEFEPITYALSWLEVSKQPLHSASSLIIECPFR